MANKIEKMLVFKWLFLSWAFYGMGTSPLLAGMVNNENGVAVIIGNKNYEGRIPAVSFAHRDANAIKRYVIDILGYNEENIIVLRDATQAKLEGAFGNERSFKGKIWQFIDPAGTSDVTVFYSGHGVPGQQDKRGYLLPVDADPETAEINGYPIDILYSNLGKLKTRSVTIMLDACFSGDSGGGMLIRSASPLFVSSSLPGASKGMTVLTAASGNQLASWDEKNRHGLFTHHLLDALYGEGDINRDGHVTAGEVKLYLDDKMTHAARKIFRRKQDASFSGNGDKVLSYSIDGKFPERSMKSSIPTVEVKKDSNVEFAKAKRFQNVHASPSGAAAVVIQIKTGALYEVKNSSSSKGKKWYEIILPDGSTGWVYGSFVDIVLKLN